jgi:hypothetical protein
MLWLSPGVYCLAMFRVSLVIWMAMPVTRVNSFRICS